MRYQVTTTQAPAEVAAAAIETFGPGGSGLTLVTHTPQRLVFTGGGGYVALTLEPRGAATVVEIEAREWDAAVQRFVARLGRRRLNWKRWWQRLRQRGRPAASPDFPPPP
ncbi:MAG: hypothetical protein KatS3mg131_0549 [Candidatus Tectimicrobiota bacterium]|nr:MAG: hypothetical protein KatS3mg131_0549 [Candidatus Tectomicrobia bacterium]